MYEPVEDDMERQAGQCGNVALQGKDLKDSHLCLHFLRQSRRTLFFLITEKETGLERERS